MNNKYSVACITLVRDKYKINTDGMDYVYNASRQQIGPHGTPARCTLQFVRRCYGLRGIYGRFDSKIQFEIKSDGRFDSNAKKMISSSLVFSPDE